MTTQTGLAVAAQQDVSPTAFVPRDYAQLRQFADDAAASSILNTSLQRQPQNVILVVMLGHELGLSPMQALNGIHVIEGRPTLSASTLLALCKSRPAVCRWFRLVSSSDTEATYQTLREGDPEPTSLSYSIEQAKKAGLTGKKNWVANTAAMLRARCSTALARAVYPDLILGMYASEEMGDGDAPVVPSAPAPTMTVVQQRPVAPPPPPPPAAKAAPVAPAAPAPTPVAPAPVAPIDDVMDAQLEPSGIAADVAEMLAAVDGAALVRLTTAARGRYAPGTPDHAALADAYRARKAALATEAA